MAKKKQSKQEEEDLFEDIEDDDVEDESLDLEEEDNEWDDMGSPEPEDDEAPVSPMGLAHEYTKESNIAKHFKELPKEVRFSFLERTEKDDVKHFARSYRNWKYISKVIALRDAEDKKINNRTIKACEITTKDEIIAYLEQEQKHYLIPIIHQLDEDELFDFLMHLRHMSPDYYIATFEKGKEDINNICDEYDRFHGVPKEIDDMDNSGKIYDTAIASMGYKGNAPQHMVMTIQAVKHEDITKASEEKVKFSFLDAIKKRLG